MEYEEIICSFKNYAKQTMDLLVDAYKWKVMAKDCGDELMRSKYMEVSNTLFSLFMAEHNNIGEMFRKD